MTEQQIARAFDRIDDLILAATTADDLDEASEKASDASDALADLRRALLAGDPNGLDALAGERAKARALA